MVTQALFLTLLATSLPSPAAPAAPPAPTSSAIAYDAGSDLIYVADEDRGELVIFPKASGPDPTQARDPGASSSGALDRPIRKIAVGEGPTAVAIGKDGTAFVAVRRAGDVVAIDRSGALRRASLGGEPFSLALSEDSATVFVTLATADAVVALDTASLAVRWRASVPSRPRPIAFLDGDRLAIGHLREPALTILDARTGAKITNLPLAGEPCAEPTQVSALLPSRGRLLAVHKVVRAGLPLVGASGGVLLNCGSTASRYGGGGFEPISLAVTVWQTAGQDARVSSFRLVGNKVFEGDPLAAAPVAAALDPIGGALFVGSPSGKGVSFLEPSVTPALMVFEHGAKIGGITAVTVSSGVVLALTADRRVLAPFETNSSGRGLGRTVDRRALAPFETKDRRSLLELGPSGLPKKAELGRQLFFSSSTKVSEGKLACATCHPDGRDDGMVWSFGLSRRQTPSLAGRLDGTAPYNWLGTAPTLEESIRQTITRLGGSGLKPREVQALALYIRDYLPKPRRPEPLQSVAEVGHGAELFQGSCAGCHVPGAAFTDGLAHAVPYARPSDPRAKIVAFLGTGFVRSQARGLGNVSETEAAFDTPSLVDLALTAPYLHDGQARSIEEVLDLTEGTMGDQDRCLSSDERSALLAYLATL
jgi:hypothetical protein